MARLDGMNSIRENFGPLHDCIDQHNNGLQVDRKINYSI